MLLVLGVDKRIFDPDHQLSHLHCLKHFAEELERLGLSHEALATQLAADVFLDCSGRVVLQ